MLVSQLSVVHEIRRGDLLLSGLGTPADMPTVLTDATNESYLVPGRGMFVSQLSVLHEIHGGDLLLSDYPRF
jgi:hypothetical protein